MLSLDSGLHLKGKYGLTMIFTYTILDQVAAKHQSLAHFIQNLKVILMAREEEDATPSRMRRNWTTSPI